MNLNTQPYKGVEDFYPEDMSVQKAIFAAVRRVCERFGYEEYNASVLEPTELYLAKTGEEIINEQTYTFEDRGGRSVTLRPEMTPTVARMVAARKRELPFPLRWYSIPNFFRYERPQRGRTREFWQPNVDIFGSEESWADVEIITILYQILKELGLEDEQFEIRVNDRKLVARVLEEAGLNEEQKQQVQKLIDRKAKMDPEKFSAELADIAGSDFVYDPEPDEQLEKLLADLKATGVANAVFAPEIMRGFDYYTGTVFEVFDTGPENNRALFGGGRYDDLLDVFGQEKVPAVGFGMGAVPMRDMLETYDLIPEYTSSADICVCYADAESQNDINAIVAQLREQGINVVTANPDKKVGDQIKYADKLKVPYVLCVGKEELTTGVFKIKQLADGSEKELKEDQLVHFLLNPQS